jgi:hypothetical protein
MKKFAVILDILTFCFFSCQNEAMDNETNKPNPFIGTWKFESENDSYLGKYKFRLTFTDSTWTTYSNYRIGTIQEAEETRTGTYEYNDYNGMIIFKDADTKHTPFRAHYYFWNGKLYVSEIGCSEYMERVD